MDTINLPEVVLDTDHTNNILNSLKTMILKMGKRPFDSPFDKNELLQELRIAVEDDDGLFQAFDIALSEEFEDQEILLKSCGRYRGELIDYMNGFNIRNILINGGKKAFKGADGVDWREQGRLLTQELEPFLGANNNVDPNLVDELDFSDLDGLAKVFDQVKEEEKGGFLLKTGYQGMNLMLGAERLGFRRGEFFLWGGLQHNFKSYWGLAIFITMMLFNKPKTYEEGKRPTFLFFTAENETRQNLTWLYKFLKENREGVPVNLDDVSTAEASKYVHDVVKETGWDLHMHRIDPTEFTYMTLIDYVEKYEAMGCEIAALWFDYLNMISKRGCNQLAGTGSEVRDLFRRTRNYMSRKNILFGTPHQLSTEAKMMLREGRQDFVKELKGKGYWDSCKTIDQEVDVEQYIHIEQYAGSYFLTCQWGKHRKRDHTDSKNHYFIYPFEEIGILPWDIDGKPKFRRALNRTPDGAEEWFG
jgi:hypothetical protein